MKKKTTYLQTEHPIIRGLETNIVKAKWGKIVDQIAEHIRAGEAYPALWKTRQLAAILENWADQNRPRIKELTED